MVIQITFVRLWYVLCDSGDGLSGRILFIPPPVASRPTIASTLLPSAAVPAVDGEVSLLQLQHQPEQTVVRDLRQSVFRTLP